MNKEYKKAAFESRTETGSSHFAFQDSGLSKIFKVIVSTTYKILNNLNVVVIRQVIWKPAHSRFTSVAHKRRVPLLPNDINPGDRGYP